MTLTAKKSLPALLISSAFVFFFGIACSKNNPATPTADQNVSQNAPVAPEPKTPAEKVQMDATFKKVSDGVEARIHITGLSPNSKHGLHIHEKGECTEPDFKSAGDHFNPQSKNHGAPGDTTSHLGDLGNIIADSNGSYSGVLKIKNATSSGPMSLLNRSLIVHEKTDDLKTQPSGDSGNRLDCVVIRSIQ